MTFRDLLLGCGSRREKLLGERKEWGELTTLDIEASHKPNIVFDLEGIGDEVRPGLVQRLPLFPDFYDELHAYEVLEHVGQQGDVRKLLAQFSEFWRVLKPGGLFLGTVPDYRSEWAWGDPSHKRVITQGTLVFLSQRQYREQVGKTPMSDFRSFYKADFELRRCAVQGGQMLFELEAIKPSGIALDWDNYQASKPSNWGPVAVSPARVIALDPRTSLSEQEDGSFYLATGDDYYDVSLTREQAIELKNWLVERLRE